MSLDHWQMFRKSCRLGCESPQLILELTYNGRVIVLDYIWLE